MLGQAVPHPRHDNDDDNNAMAKTKGIKTIKPGSLKTKETSPLQANKITTHRTKKAASPAAKRTTVAKFLALQRTGDGEFCERTLQKTQALKQSTKDDDMRAVIVQSDIPHGSFKGQISHYFRQFGVLENVKPGCSKRTGQSYGYAYMVFQHYEVAKIMAVDMNGYLTFAKIVKCSHSS
ncbi:hypothetical protein O3P69_005801 [Scylla paramamosain]|uniref:RRM domain-containing protein n=1 Tax=Scylla paramamosain TaxID=85552 RepID=A0AAW0U855_SCYPA